MQRGCYLGEHSLMSARPSLTCDRVFSMIHHQHHARAIAFTVRVPSLLCIALHHPRNPVLCQPTAHPYRALRAWEKHLKLLIVTTRTAALVSLSAFCSVLIQQCKLTIVHTEMDFFWERGYLVGEGTRVEADLHLGGTSGDGGWQNAEP